MKLTKENVYVDLQGKTKEELTELYWLLKNNNEPLYRDSLDLFLKYPECYNKLNFYRNKWCGTDSVMFLYKTEVTIEQLKEILQPMETLQEKEQRLLRDLEEVRKEIEKNKPKAGDWCKFWDDNEDEFVIGKLQEIYEVNYITAGTHFFNYEKITNPELIKLLENESKRIL